MLRVGDVAPGFCERPIFGRDVDLLALAGSRPVGLCFVGHTNSPISHRAFQELHDHVRDFDLADVELLVVTPSGLTVARDFVPRYHVLFPVISDLEGKIFDAYSVGTSTRLDALQLFRPDLLRDVARRFKGGIGPRALSLEGQEARLPAEFVISPQGRIAYARYSETVMALPDVVSLLEAGKACRLSA